MKPGFVRLISARPSRRFGLMVSICAGLMCSSPGWSLTLTQAYQAALGSDPVFASARASYTASVEQLPQARSGLLPWVTATGDVSYSDTRTRFTNQLPRRKTHADNYGYQLVLSQPLF